MLFRILRSYLITLKKELRGYKIEFVLMFLSMAIFLFHI